MTTIRVAAAIILKDDLVLIAKRPEGKHKAGYWEFPGGKIEIGETPEQALAREIEEELAIHISDCEAFTEVAFDYPEKQVLLSFFLVTKFSGNPIGHEGQLVSWVKRAELTQYQFPEANIPVVKKLLSI